MVPVRSSQHPKPYYSLNAQNSPSMDTLFRDFPNQSQAEPPQGPSGSIQASRVNVARSVITAWSVTLLGL
ncbi:hypothetical protein SV7mr_26470 [Stieleria bergensis]|uniref:Uncharacterized protein n=1 Tax=Stieleria bergensis TaxID=2528025 RepID=A0A517SVJ2_9BACT|nr:hypothetical protein SV7mr_26470 [Planctomycetes bacterium SV_7m_r]